jgi:GTP cyclohydrolase II
VSARNVARAIDALRRGWPIAIQGAGAPVGVLAIETADAGRMKAFDPAGESPILLSAGRAATLRLANQIEAAVPDSPVLVERTFWIDFDCAVALADPQLDMATPMKGPFRAVPVHDRDVMTAALTLARTAGVLPAFFVGAAPDDGMITIADIEDFEDPLHLEIAARARLPVAGSEKSEIVAFRSPDSPGEHVALIVGQPDGRPPLVRLQCAGGPQLHAAIHAMEDTGWGILLYLRQEGRGIGLVNKLRAYALQDQGFDTVDANTRLGFAIDARDFRIATRMLDLLGQTKIRLLTNNPDKVRVLEATGIEVVERVPIALPSNPFNAKYLATKRDRTGHQL